MKIRSSATAADLMQKDVFTLDADASVGEAVRAFEEYHIGGAPVRDAAGAIVGFLSSHDLARLERAHERWREAVGVAEPAADDPFGDGAPFEFRPGASPSLTGEAVRDWMSPATHTVAPGTSLQELCRIMVEKSIHRVPVVEGGALKGIVTTTDVVRFVASDA